MYTQGDQKVTQPKGLHLLLARNECDKGTASAGHMTWHHHSSGFNISFSQMQHVFIVEHYFQSQSYLKCQDNFSSAFQKSQVPYKSAVFHSVACFHETGSVSDWRCSSRPMVFNDDWRKHLTFFSAVSTKFFKKTCLTDWTVLQKYAKNYKEINI